MGTQPTREGAIIPAMFILEVPRPGMPSLSKTPLAQSPRAEGSAGHPTSLLSVQEAVAAVTGWVGDGTGGRFVCLIDLFSCARS